MKKSIKNLISFLFVLGIFALFGNTALASPSILSSKASPGKTDVVLEGTVNPNGYLATAWFEYGTSDNLINFNETTHIIVGSSTFESFFSGKIFNLTPDTTYYFRTVSDNARGTKKGDIYSFTTKKDSGEEIPSGIETPSSDDTSNDINLGASPVSGTNFFPSTLLGWTILILILVVLIWVTRRMYLDEKLRRESKNYTLHDLPISETTATQKNS